MMFYTHLALGFLSGLLAMKYFAASNIYIFFAIVLFSSILPDIDIRNSKIGKGTKTGWLVEWVFGHRGFFHSLFPAFFLFLYFYFISYYEIGFAVLVGYTSHLIGDALGSRGVYLFYPYKKVKLSGFIKAGGILEHLLLGLVVYLSIQILI